MTTRGLYRQIRRLTQRNTELSHENAKLLRKLEHYRSQKRRAEMKTIRTVYDPEHGYRVEDTEYPLLKKLVIKTARLTAACTRELLSGTKYKNWSTIREDVRELMRLAKELEKEDDDQG